MCHALDSWKTDEDNFGGNELVNKGMEILHYRGTLPAVMISVIQKLNISCQFLHYPDSEDIG
jgi:hypothetical protein